MPITLTRHTGGPEDLAGVAETEGKEEMAAPGATVGKVVIPDQMAGTEAKAVMVAMLQGQTAQAMEATAAMVVMVAATEERAARARPAGRVMVAMEATRQAIRGEVMPETVETRHPAKRATEEKAASRKAKVAAETVATEETADHLELEVARGKAMAVEAIAERTAASFMNPLHCYRRASTTSMAWRTLQSSHASPAKH